MSYKFLRASLAGGSAVAMALLVQPALAAAQADPGAGEALPEIVVQAPSPIQRRIGIARSRAAPQPLRTGTAASAPNPETYAGTPPIVTDQFATVTVVPNEEIRRCAASTLGDLLANKPGITGSSLRAGRIEPADHPRPRRQSRRHRAENGIGSNGASDLGEDHFVPIDPLPTNQVEVIRGPATLRYGSQSIGGVVSASATIAFPMRCRTARWRRRSRATACRRRRRPPVSRRSSSCLNAEVRTSFSSVDRRCRCAACCSMPAATSQPCRCVYSRKAGDYSAESHLLRRARPCLQRQAAELGEPVGRRIGRRLVLLHRRLYRRGDQPEQHDLSHSGR